MFALGYRQRVDDAILVDRRLAEPLQLRIDEGDVEAGIVGDQVRAVDEGDELVGYVGEGRLVGEVGRADAVDRLRLRMDSGVPAG